MMKHKTPNQEFNAYQEVKDMVKEAIKQENLHTQSAPETRERLRGLEVNQNNIMEEIQEIKALICELKVDVKEALNNKADKWVERVVYGIGIAIGGMIISFITWFIATGMDLRF